MRVLLLRHTTMTSRSPLVVSSLGLFCALALLQFRSCSAQDCADNGGVLYNGACYAFAAPSVSCTDKCLAEGTSCDEDALEMSHPECEGVIAALGVDIASSYSSWYYNFGPPGRTDSSSAWYSSVFDENVAPLGSFKTSGCVVSPAFDASDQDSFTTLVGTFGTSGAVDAAEAHNFLQETPTCDGASSVYRRVCSCFFIATSTTPSPTTPAPTTPAPTTPAPTTPAPATQAPTTSTPTTPAPTTPHQTTPHPTPDQTPSLIEAGFWRTGEASVDVRPCPIPDLCEGGFGGGDDLCVSSNTGPYCQVCPRSYFSSVNGVCVECGSVHGVTAVQSLGMMLAVLLLLGVATFVGPVSKQALETGKGDDTPQKGSVPLLHVHATQQATIDMLRKKMLDLGLLVTNLRHNLLDESPQRSSTEVKDLLVTTEMFTLKLIRLLPRAPNPGPGTAMKQVFLQAHLLCPAIDQLASALAGLSGAVPGEEATIIAQIK